MSSSGFKKSRAHGFSAVSTAVGVALTLLLLGALLALAVVMRDLRMGWMSSFSMEVVLARDVDSRAGGAELEALWMEEPEVVRAEFVSADSASAELERALGEPFMDFLGEAPLPPVVELGIEPQWIGQHGSTGLATLAADWSKRPGVVRVSYPKNTVERIEQGFSDWALPAGGLAVLLIAVVVAQIMNVVRLSVFGRRHLIRSMELVGAPPGKVRRPFIAEAMGYGAVGALLAYAAIVGVLTWLKPFLAVLEQWGPAELVMLLGIQLLAGLMLTGMSAAWAVGRYLGSSLDKLM